MLLFFASLLEELLRRFECEAGGSLVVATLCLLEASAAGLTETELRQLLADEESLMPPAPFDEKGMTELRQLLADEESLMPPAPFDEKGMREQAFPGVVLNSSNQLTVI